MSKESKENPSIYLPKNHASGVGKTTLVIDDEIYGDINSDNPRPSDSFYGMNFGIWGSEYNSRDRFRIEMGKYWDLIVPGESPGIPIDPSKNTDPTSPGELIYGHEIGLWTRFWYAHRLKYNLNQVIDIDNTGDGGMKIARAMYGNLPMTIVHHGESSEAQKAAYPISTKLAKDNGAKLYSVSVDLDVGNTRFDEIYSAIDEWRGYVYGTGDHPGIIRESTQNGHYFYESDSFIATAPFSNIELEKMNSGPGAISADIKTYYSPNFAFDKYIDTIESSEVQEYTLPNLYSFLLLSEKEDEPSTFTNKLSHIISNITLGSSMQIATNHKGEKIFPEVDLKTALHTMDRERYYNVYSYVLSSILGDLGNEDGISKNVLKQSSAYENVVFTESTADMMREFSEYKSSFPMSTNIVFKTDRDVALTNLLNESYLMPAIIEKVVEATDIDIPDADNYGTMFGIKSKQFVELSDQYTIEESPTQDSELRKKQVFKETIRKTWDLEAIANAYQAMGEDYINKEADNHTVFFSTDELDFSDPSSSIVKTILLAVFKNKMQEYISNRARTYEEVLNGEHADAEIVLYRIEKSKFNTVTEDYEFCQNIYVPNSNKIDIANIIDTQVKYGVFYRYRVYAYYAVVGTQYSYWNVWAGGANLPMLHEPTAPLPAATPELCENNSSMVFTGYDASGNPIYGQYGAVVGECAPPPSLGQPDPLSVDPIGNQAGTGLGNSLGPIAGNMTGPLNYGGTTAPGGQGGDLPSQASPTGLPTQEGLELPVSPLENPEAIPQWPDAVMSLKFDVMMKPTLKLVELPHFNVDPGGHSMVLDRPPLPPQVNIIPYRATKDKITFFFDGSVGKETVLPVIIEDGDQEYYDIQRLAQSVGTGEAITFNSDNSLVSFQVFRTVNPPRTYKDFQGKKIFTTSTTQFTDLINPNQKYYYMFRSIDSRGNISNPSVIYEIELVTLEDGGDAYRVAVLPRIKLYNLPKPTRDNYARGMRKYLLIRPSADQAELNETVSALPGSKDNPTMNLNLVQPVLGVSENSLFAQQDISGSAVSNKKFKLRITSKTTGRRLDVNFQFKHKHEKPLIG